MKAVVQSRVVRSSQSSLPTNGCRRVAGKSSMGNKGEIDSKEMLTYFSKLQELVPNARCRAGQADRTELLQSVIDYIYLLEDTLAFSSSGLCRLLDSSLVSSRTPRHCGSESNAEDGYLSSRPIVSQTEDSELRPPSQ